MKPNFNNNFKNKLFIWVVIFFTIFAISSFLSSDFSNVKKVKFSEFLDLAESNNLTNVEIKGNNLIGTLKDGTQIHALSTEYSDLINILRENQVNIEILPLVTKSTKLVAIFLSWLPFLIMIGLWIFFMKNAGGAGKALGFGKSKAKLLQQDQASITFKDVAGIDEAKEELVELVDFLKRPQKYTEIGAKIPKGCLLIGSPGTGKTLLAKAIAGEASVPFFSISGSDFVEMFVGVGASRVRDMFEQAKKQSPCLVFIDEIDAVGRHRGSGVGGGNDEREQTLNQLLVEMDGFTENTGIVIIAATNRADVLDKALLRPGRFDRQVYVPNPDIKGREEILKVHIKKVKSAPDVDVNIIARGTPGFSGAELANIINESAITAVKNKQKIVTMKDIEFAKDKILMGSERKSMIMSKEEKELTAYHEAGHAIVAYYCEHSDPYSQGHYYTER